MSKIQSLFLLLATFSLSGCSLFPAIQAPNEPEVSSSVHETSNPVEPQITSIETNEPQVPSSVHETSNPGIPSDSESSSSEQVESIVITVDQTAVTLKVGQTIFVTATVSGSMNKNVTWTSSVPAVATVSGGTITALQAGSAIIAAASVADPTKTATVQVTVTEPVVGNMKISEVLQIGSQLPNDGYTFSEEFTTRGVYTGMNNVVVQSQGKDQRVARFIQDGDSALLIYTTYDEDWAGVQIGDVVEVTTAVCNSFGLIKTGFWKNKSVKKVTDPSIVTPNILNVSATSNPILTSADVNRKAHLEAVEVTSASTDSYGNMTVRFSAGEGQKEETLYLKGSDNDLNLMAGVIVGSLITLDTWVGVGYKGEGFQYTYFDNLEVDNSNVSNAKEAKMGEIAEAGSYIVEGVVTLITKAAVYLDDGTGAVSIYYGSGNVPATYEVGQKYKITGAASAYHGEYLFAADSIVEESTVEVAETFLSKPTVTNLEQLNADTKQTRNLVAFKGSLTVKKKGDSTNFFFGGDITTSAISPIDCDETFAVGGEYVVKGYLASWNSKTSYFSLYVASASRIRYDVESVALNKTEASLIVGLKTALVSTITPAAADQSVTWASSDPAVATVEGGKVTGVAPGIATITATSVADPSKSASATVTVVAEPTSYTKVGSYDFGTGNTSYAMITDPAVALARFDSSKSADFPESVVTEVKDISKLIAGYANYYQFGLKLGAASGAGSMTTVLSVSVFRVVVKWIGWTATDTLAVGDCEPVVSGKKYNDEGVELREDQFDINPSNEISFAFNKRGFIQAIEFYSAS
ncbi:MAG: Ig-like domain-containing protein [Candidatus Enteromonas sp.]|nr:Ig-like domain-containing protein [Candidatus Enteromonas sp.]